MRQWLFAGELGQKGRLLMLAAAMLVALSFLGPLWSLSLGAPQYPEGLKVHVYAHKLGGRVDIVNSLNHYIGMRPIREEDFAEFDYLPRIFGAMGALMLLGAIIGRRWVAGLVLVVTPSLLLLLYDLRRWLHQFGHDLDPRAPIRIAPFTPPMVGWNRLANFVTFSYFNWGTLLVLAAIGLVVYAVVVTRPARAPRTVPEGVKA
ncbi:MAG: hypothetical protein AB1609_22660 [Bacillota bacterium]